MVICERKKNNPDIVYFRIFPFISDKENAFYNKSFVEKAT